MGTNNELCGFNINNMLHESKALSVLPVFCYSATAMPDIHKCSIIVKSMNKLI